MQGQPLDDESPSAEFATARIRSRHWSRCAFARNGYGIAEDRISTLKQSIHKPG
jgi:hypothetical protein